MFPCSKRSVHARRAVVLTILATGVLAPALHAQNGSKFRSRTTRAPESRTTRAAESTNNTAACSEAGYGLNGIPYCGDASPSFTDRSSISGATVPLTQPHNPAVSGAWNISKGRRTASGNVHSLLYPGNTTRILAELQFWWCFGEDNTLSNPRVTVDGQTFYRNQNCPVDNQGRVPWSSHLVIGYDSNNQDKADAVADDLWDRGFDGAVGDWSGDSNTCKSGTGAYSNNAPLASPCETAVITMDQSYQKFFDSMARRQELKFAMMYDESAYKFTQCNVADTYQPQCIQNKIFADSAALVSKWFPMPNYLTLNGQPVLMFFIAENAINFSQCDGNDASGNPTQCHLTNDFTCHNRTACWNSLWDGVRTNFIEKHGVNPYLIFENNPNHEQADGNFSWVQPSGGSTAPTPDVQDNWGQSYLDEQLSAAASMIANNETGGNGMPKTYMAGAWKGFDDRMASWSPSWDNGAPVPADVTAPHYPRIMSQQCGNTWLYTFREVKKYFNTSLQLPFLMVGTWDDYEEGSEIETGIDNCVSSLDASVRGSSLNWTISFTSPGSECTVDHYTVFYSTDGDTGEQLRRLATVPVGGSKDGSYSLDLRNYQGTLPEQTGLYVKAVGKASLANHMSVAVPYKK